MFSQLRQHSSKNLEPQIFFVSQSVGTSLGDTNLVIQSFDEPQRDFVFRSAVSGNAVPMLLDHLRKFLVRSKPLPFERRLPVFKEAPGPTLALVAPQLTKGFLKQVGGIESLVGIKQGLKRLAAFKRKVVPARQERVPLPLDETSIFAHQPPRLAFSNLIQRLAQMAHHMELVVQNGRLRRTGFSGTAKWLPHVHHRQANPCTFWFSQLTKELPQAFLRTVLTTKPDRSAPFQVAHHNPVSVTFASRYLVNADNLRLGFTGMRELRLDILLVQLFDRVPVKFKFLGYVFDGRRAATTPDMVGKPLGVKRVVRQKRQLLPLHFPAVSTKDPANFELQVHPRVSTRQVSYPTRSSVVPTPLYSRAAPAGRFFDRRTRLTTRAFGSPKTPRTVGCTRNPLNAYVSHNRRTRFFDVAIATPCQNSPYPENAPLPLPKRLSDQFNAKIYPLDYAKTLFIVKSIGPDGIFHVPYEQPSPRWIDHFCQGAGYLFSADFKHDAPPDYLCLVALCYSAQSSNGSPT